MSLKVLNRKKMIFMLLSLLYLLTAAERTHMEKLQDKKKRKFISPPRTRPLQRKDWGNWKIPTFSDAEKAAKKAKEWTEKAAKKAKEETEKAAKKAKEETEKKAKEAKELAEKAIKETQKLQAKITNLAGKFLGTTQEGQYYYFKSYAVGAIADQSNWMSKLSDNTGFTQLSLPGTHNTMAYKGCNTLHCKCNSINLLGQLKSGIRALDIRCRHFHNACTIHHGMEYLESNLDDVLGTIRTFLKSNPKEVVFMRLKNEHKAEGNSRTYDDTWQWYNSRYSDIMSSHIPESNPTLGQVRGKLLVLHGSGNSKPYIQDEYKVSDWTKLYDKWKHVKIHLIKTNGQKDSGNIYINFLSGASSNFIHVNPWFVASGFSSTSTYSPCMSTGLTTFTHKSTWPDFPRVACALGGCTICYKGINILFGEMLKKHNYHTGIVFMDFPGKDLIEAIINQNDFFEALDFKGWSPSFKLGRCQGDCDNDGHCNNGLKCFHRDKNTVVPSCTNGGQGDKTMADYCI